MSSQNSETSWLPNQVTKLWRHWLQWYIFLIVKTCRPMSDQPVGQQFIQTSVYKWPRDTTLCNPLPKRDDSIAQSSLDHNRIHTSWLGNEMWLLYIWRTHQNLTQNCWLPMIVYCLPCKTVSHHSVEALLNPRLQIQQSQVHTRQPLFQKWHPTSQSCPEGLLQQLRAHHRQLWFCQPVQASVPQTTALAAYIMTQTKHPLITALLQQL